MDIRDEFIRFAKEEYNIDVVAEPSDTPDSFESVFGTSFLDAEKYVKEFERLGYTHEESVKLAIAANVYI